MLIFFVIWIKIINSKLISFIGIETILLNWCIRPVKRNKMCLCPILQELLWIDHVLSFASSPSLTIIGSATMWWIHQDRYGGAILWGLLSRRPWCKRNSCSAKCPKKLRTGPTRRAQWPKTSSYSERTGGYILIHIYMIFIYILLHWKGTKYQK